MKFSPLIAPNVQAQKRPTTVSSRLDDMYVKVKGKSTYLCRAVDHEDKVLDFMLSERRDTAAARRFLKRAIGTNGKPDRVVIDKSGANSLPELGVCSGCGLCDQGVDLGECHLDG
jgi:putative transposase